VRGRVAGGAPRPGRAEGGARGPAPNGGWRPLFKAGRLPRGPFSCIDGLRRPLGGGRGVRGLVRSPRPMSSLGARARARARGGAGGGAAGRAGAAGQRGRPRGGARARARARAARGAAQARRARGRRERREPGAVRRACCPPYRCSHHRARACAEPGQGGVGLPPAPRARRRRWHGEGVGALARGARECESSGERCVKQRALKKAARLVKGVLATAKGLGKAAAPGRLLPWAAVGRPGARRAARRRSTVRARARASAAGAGRAPAAALHAKREGGCARGAPGAAGLCHCAQGAWFYGGGPCGWRCLGRAAPAVAASAPRKGRPARGLSLRCLHAVARGRGVQCAAALAPRHGRGRRAASREPVAAATRRQRGSAVRGAAGGGRAGARRAPRGAPTVPGLAGARAARGWVRRGEAVLGSITARLGLSLGCRKAPRKGRWS
jgi:hypothetical protein